MWTVLADNGSPMQEATLCPRHFYAWSDDCMADATNADDYAGSDWVVISDEQAAANDVRCLACVVLEGEA